ncbi:ABC transporter substrate-binding protein [Paenibacillus sacheonensis]|uniref:Extracellular solute-binding protein n=1 Tax=Paenibacillus sacheonensis TaxID=742054 RepID=A0A7X5C0P7_9BACL|nr:ABC transporter substrate-binding protein [Paenibacillus sacheonensis]MBM7568211.1 multiple sugar transport system substrate-binding protein [Paenibacillus sacheonensis]NBC71791.1 extracellular solute-binding protein [Paenibacillus sacheonensis]
MARKKRQLMASVVVLTCAASLVLTGCGSTNDNASNNGASNASGNTSGNAGASNSGESSGKVTKITFWHPFGGATEKAAMDEGVKMFNETHKDIQVKAEFIGGSGQGNGITDKLTVAINGSNPPDVVVFDRFMVQQWASEGLFEELTENAQANGVTADQFYDFSWKEASVGDKLYAMPFTTDDRALFYNKTLFKEAGLDPEKPPTTIAELDEYAEKLTKKNGSRYDTLGFIPWMGQGGVLTWGWAFGGKYQDPATGKITANDPAIVKALQWEQGYAAKYDAKKVGDFATAVGGDINPFAAGKVGMIVGGSWEIGQYKDVKGLDYGVAPLPSQTGTDPTTWAGGWSFIVPKGAKNKDAAFEFAKFMTMEDGAKNYAEKTGWFICQKDMNAQLSWVQSEPRYKTFIDMFPTAYARPIIKKGQFFFDQLNAAQDKALNSKGDAQKLLDDVTNKTNAELEKK